MRSEGIGTDNGEDARPSSIVETTQNSEDQNGQRADPRARVRILLRVLGFLSFAVAFTLFQFTQTDTGRNAAASIIQRVLANAVNGQVVIGPVLDGNVLTRVTLSQFRIDGPDSSSFIVLDTVTVEYDPLALFGKHLRIRRIHARHAAIHLVQGVDKAWNYDQIFGTSHLNPDFEQSISANWVELVKEPIGLLRDIILNGEEGETPLRISLFDASLERGSIEIRTPWTAGLDKSARERALSDARAGESLWAIRESGNGEFERVYRLENISGNFPVIRLVDPPRPFRLLIEDVSGTLHAVNQPLELSHLSGTVTLGDTARVEIKRFETKNSTVFGTGWLASAVPLEYDFQLSAEPLGFEDVRWLPIPMPRLGGGSMEIGLTSRLGDMVVTVSDADIRSEDTQLRGGFVLAMGQTPRFENLDFSLEPLRLQWLNRVLSREQAVDGWIRGSLEGSGPVDDLTIDATLSLADLTEGTTTSEIRAQGGIGIVQPFAVHNLELDLETFEPKWVRILGPDPPLAGRINGTVTLDNNDNDDLIFTGDVSHFTSTGDFSGVSGSGTLDFSRDRLVDLTLEVRPLALNLLSPWVPGVELAGSVSGPIRMRGNRSNLSATATLESSRGRLTINGSFGLDNDEPRYDMQIEATNLPLDQWIEGAPDSRLGVYGRVNGRGYDPTTLEAEVDLEVLPSQFDLVEIYDGRFRFNVSDGVAAVDTLYLSTDVGFLSARGDFGLDESQMETMEFSLQAPDLSDWDRWFIEAIPGESIVATEEALFDSFEAAFSGASDEEATEGLSGGLGARGSVAGRWKDFTVDVFIEGSQVRFERYRADTLSARIQLFEPPTADATLTQFTAVGADLDGRRLDSLDVRWERSIPAGNTLEIHARRDSTLEVSARGKIEAGSNWNAHLERLRLRLGKLESTLARPFQLTYVDSAFVVDGLLLTGPLGHVEANGTVPATGEGELLVNLSGIRMDQLAHLFSESPQVGGILEGSARLEGTLTDPRFAGTLHIADPSIRTHRYTGLEAQFDYADSQLEGLIDLTGESARLARVSGSVFADLSFRRIENRFLDDPIDLSIQGDSVPLTLLELRVEGLEEISGVGRADITLRGRPGTLNYGGGLRISDGRSWVPDLGVWLTDVDGQISFRGSQANLESGYLASDLGGFLEVEGTLDITSLTDPKFALAIDATDFHAISRLDMSLKVSGEGGLGGWYTQPILTGQFNLSEGDIRQDEFLRQRRVLDLRDPSIYTLLDSASVRERRLLERFRNPFMDNLVVDANVSLGPNLWLRSPELDVELISENLAVEVDRSQDLTTVRGGVELPRGTYRFDRLPPYVQALRITSGAIQFVGNPDFNPNLSISAEYRNQTVEGPVVIEARIGGRLRESTLDLTSNPPMSETDRLCFLAVGTPCYQSADSQLGQRLVRQSILGTVSSGISSALVGSTGLSYFNLRSIGGGERGVGLQGSQSVFDLTLVEVGWYAGQDLFLSFSQPLGGGPARAALEWMFLPNWTIEARSASRFDERLFGMARGTNLVNERTFGLFLFRDWDF